MSSSRTKEIVMKYRIVGLLVMGMVLGLGGCGKHSAEEAGQKVDEAAAQAKEGMQEAGDAMKDTAGDVKEAAGDVADAAKEAGQEVKDDMKKD
jgi:hypothetical protein